MKTYLLPNDLFDGSETQLSIYDYLINNSLTRNKITLNQNVFSFLQDGTKEVVHFDKQKTINFFSLNQVNV